MKNLTEIIKRKGLKFLQGKTIVDKSGKVVDISKDLEEQIVLWGNTANAQQAFVDWLWAIDDRGRLYTVNAKDLVIKTIPPEKQKRIIFWRFDFMSANKGAYVADIHMRQNKYGDFKMHGMTYLLANKVKHVTEGEGRKILVNAGFVEIPSDFRETREDFLKVGASSQWVDDYFMHRPEETSQNVYWQSDFRELLKKELERVGEADSFNEIVRTEGVSKDIQIQTLDDNFAGVSSLDEIDEFLVDNPGRNYGGFLSFFEFNNKVYLLVYQD